MALVKCTECKSEISSTALFCPKCGCKKPFKGVKLSKAEAKDMGIYQRAVFRRRGGKVPRTRFQKFLFISYSAIFVLILVKCTSTPDDAPRAEHTAKQSALKALLSPAPAVATPKKGHAHE